jgi:hypothetical protein
MIRTMHRSIAPYDNECFFKLVSFFIILNLVLNSFQQYFRVSPPMNKTLNHDSRYVQFWGWVYMSRSLHHEPEPVHSLSHG